MILSNKKMYLIHATWMKLENLLLSERPHLHEFINMKYIE